MSFLTADDLLAGAALVHDVIVDSLEGGRVRLRPLTVRDVQLVTKAARDDDGLLSALMLKEALVEPVLTLDQVQGLPAGLARFLVDEVCRVSGLAVDEDELGSLVQAPLARATFALAREFGWSPQEIGELTMGQVLLYLEMIGAGADVERARGS